VRILDYRELDRLEDTGTSVLGQSETTLHGAEGELSMLTLVGEVGEPGRLQAALAQWLEQSGHPLAALSVSRRFTCVYLPTQVADAAYASLHDRLAAQFPELLNISLRGRIGELRLRSARFLDQPGVLAEVTGVLANAKINIIEMITGPDRHQRVYRLRRHGQGDRAAAARAGTLCCLTGSGGLRSLAEAP
jgi:hypothetical protein